MFNMNTKTIALLVTVLGLAGCNTGKKETKEFSQTGRFINPPLPGINVPFREYTVEAGLGDTLFYETGSILLFPPNAFVDANGNAVRGKVKVHYREFRGPADFYLAGIPMEYDSLGKTYDFESSGMCEVIAFHEGRPVFVNPNHKPEIFLATDNNSPSHNLYYLDTAQKSWVKKGESNVSDISITRTTNPAQLPVYGHDLIEPVKPAKADANRPIIQILINPASFKELLAYDNLKFQLEPGETNFNAKDTSDEWTDVGLRKGKEKDIYIITFTNAKRKVSYTAKPVLTGGDYDKALKVFEKNTALYNRKLNERLEKEKIKMKKNNADSLAYEQLLADNRRIERLNLLIEARNREVDRLNTMIEEKNKLRQEAFLSANLIRGFAIDGFGIWNCDQAISNMGLPITATFRDVKGDTISLTHIAVLYREFNGICSFNNNKLTIAKDAGSMVIGIHDGKFRYINYEGVKALGINSATKEVTFTMTEVPEKDNNYAYIKKIAIR